MQLAQANKVRCVDKTLCHSRTSAILTLCFMLDQLLDFYRLVTSTDIRLIESAEDDEDEEASDHFTEIACATTDGESGKRFNFELAIPDSRTSEIDFLPSEHPTKGLKVPSYLQVRGCCGCDTIELSLLICALSGRAELQAVRDDEIYANSVRRCYEEVGRGTIKEMIATAQHNATRHVFAFTVLANRLQ